MTGALERLFTSAPGQAIATRLGLPEPPVLRRGRTRPDGPVVLASISGSDLAARTLDLLGFTTQEAVLDRDGEPQADPDRIGCIVIDALGLHAIAELELVRAALRPAVRALAPSGRVVVLVDAASDGVEANAVRHSLDGITRTVGKEIRAGATANLILTSANARPKDLASTIGFLLEGRSAYVDGQAWLVGRSDGVAAPSTRPLDGRVVVVTGAARGIGAQIASVAARDGAQVVCVDVPAAGEALATLANRLRGTALQLDVTAPDAGERIAAHVASRNAGDVRVHGIVHNAGITRDKLLVNTDAARWAAVLEVNLAAQLRINPVLLDGRPGGLADGGRIVSIASTSGIAGNRGQANYAASKAGVIGVVEALAPQLASRGITVNAVAPGFIETEMTAKIPFVQREVFRRTSSLGQGGAPVDVAETICYLLDPASAGVNGQVIRVCGQNVVGR